MNPEAYKPSPLHPRPSHPFPHLMQYSMTAVNSLRQVSISYPGRRDISAICLSTMEAPYSPLASEVMNSRKGTRTWNQVVSYPEEGSRGCTDGSKDVLRNK